MPTQNNAQKNGVQKAQRLGGGKLNDDWEYLEEKTAPNNPTIDQKFNLSYKSRGINSASIKQPKLIKKTTNEKDNSVTYTYRSKAGFVKKENIEEIEEDGGFFARISNKKHARLAKIINRRLAWSFGYLWLFVQLPFALLSLIGFLAMGAFDVVSNANWLTQSIAFVVKGAVDTVTSLIFGVTSDDIIAALALVLWLVVFVIGFITLMTIFILHALANNKPLSSDHTSFKIGILLLAIIGYSVPILQLFPWYMAWLWVIGKYPR